MMPGSPRSSASRWPSGRWALWTGPSSGVRKRWLGPSRWGTPPSLMYAELLVEMLQGVPQGGVGDFDEALQGPVQIDDEEDSYGDRASTHEQNREDGGISRSEQTEADEEEGKPEHQDEEEWERELGLFLFNQQPATLTQVAHDLLGLVKGLAHGVVL